MERYQDSLERQKYAPLYQRLSEELAPYRRIYKQAVSDLNSKRPASEQIPLLSLAETRAAFRDKFAEWARNGSLQVLDQQTYPQDKRFRLFISPNVVLQPHEAEKTCKQAGLKYDMHPAYATWSPEELCPVRPGGSPVNFTLISDEPTMTEWGPAVQRRTLQQLRQQYPSLLVPGDTDTLFRTIEITQSLHPLALHAISDLEDITKVTRIDLAPRCTGYGGEGCEWIPATHLRQNEVWQGISLFDPGATITHLALG